MTSAVAFLLFAFLSWEAYKELRLAYSLPPSIFAAFPRAAGILSVVFFGLTILTFAGIINLLPGG